MHRTFLPLLILLSSSLSCAPAIAARTYNVSTADGLADAIARADSGDRILLAAGNYGSVDIRGKQWGADVTLVSATPSNPARLDSLLLNNVAHLVVKSVQIGRPLKQGEPDYAVFCTVREGLAITFDDVFFRGSMDNNPGNDGNGVNIVDSRVISINASRFEQLGRGMQASASTEIYITNNVFRDMRSDGMNFANVQSVTIDGNKFSDFAPQDGDHPDAIQFWTAGTKQASSNIVIRNNQILQGRGAGTQGIFLSDEVGTLPYQNVRIENNLLYVYDGYNGIMISNGRQIEIVGNSVLSEPTDDQKYWIRLLDVEGATVRGNIADSFVDQNNRSINMEDNVFLDKKASLAARIKDLRAQANATAGGLTVAGYGYQPPGP